MTHSLIVSGLFGTMIVNFSALVINEKTSVELGVVVACTGSIIGIVIWATSKVQKVLNRLENGDGRMERMEERLKLIESVEREIRRDMKQ